jgi:hypothetical protein
MRESDARVRCVSPMRDFDVLEESPSSNTTANLEHDLLKSWTRLTAMKRIPIDERITLTNVEEREGTAV